MAVFRCKMCGGTLRMAADKKTGVCEFCGSEQTAPTINSASVASMYEKASDLRRNNDFDAANDIYSKVLKENAGDPESYWSMVLCKYGVEYVEDPGSNKRIPTVNRTQYMSIFDDPNYKKTIQLSSGHQRDIYVEEATKINEVQKGILEVSKHESPYDVFISYKETDEYGRRTRDSVYAHEVYNELTRQDLRVFFAPVSLQNILGAAYEPHIFAALNSAKVMVVIGTSKERFNAVWVKNEWSRFLKLMKEGKKKTLIPAYRDMDPYDLPPEFARLQALNMTKLGFMVDLVEGVKKIVDNSRSREVSSSSSGGGSSSKSASKLLSRAQMFLEDGDWGGAKDAVYDILNRDSENGEAYLYLLMSQARVKNIDELANARKPISNYSAYRNAIKYGDDQQVDLLRSINNQQIDNQNNRYNNNDNYSAPAPRREEPVDPRQKEIKECEARIKSIKSQMKKYNGLGKVGKKVIILLILSMIVLFIWFILMIAFISNLSYEISSPSYSSYYKTVFPSPGLISLLVWFLIFTVAMYVFAIILCKKFYKYSPKSSKGYVALTIFAPHASIFVCGIRILVILRRGVAVDSGKLTAEQNAQLSRLREQLTEEEMRLEALKQNQ